MKLFLSLLLLIAVAVPVMAGDTVVNLPVWPGVAPGETTTDVGDTSVDQASGMTRVTNITSAHLLVYEIPDGETHPTALVFPGGGYSFLSEESEGSQIAEWLNQQGFVAAVLLYRCPNNRDGAYQDAQRAVSLLRGRASEFGIDPTHVGVIGFSAGGHLAARLSAGFGKRSYPLVDAYDTESCRPDFTALIYPAYLVDTTTGALETDVIPIWNGPATFLAQTKLDPFYDIIPYSNALQCEAISEKTFNYDGGGHGYGLYPPSDQPVADWPKQAAAWFAAQVAPPPSAPLPYLH